MKKNVLKVVVLFVFVLVVTAGCFIKEKGESPDHNTEEGISQSTKKEITIGQWNENIYSNEFLGLTFTKPENWTRYSDEQIKELMNIGAEMMDVSEINKKILELTSVTYMMAVDVNGTSIIVMSEKPVISISTYNYVEKLKKQLETQSQYSYELGDIKTEVVNGKEFITLDTTVTSFYQYNQKYYTYNIDNYIVGIIISSASGEDPDTLLQHFTFE